MQFLSERKWSQNYVLIETFHISLSLFQTLDKRDFEEDLWGKECEYFDCWRPVRLGLRAIERSLWEKKMMVGSMQKRGSCIPPMIWPKKDRNYVLPGRDGRWAAEIRILLKRGEGRDWWAYNPTMFWPLFSFWYNFDHFWSHQWFSCNKDLPINGDHVKSLWTEFSSFHRRFLFQWSAGVKVWPGFWQLTACYDWWLNEWMIGNFTFLLWPALSRASS